MYTNVSTSNMSDSFKLGRFCFRQCYFSETTHAKRRHIYQTMSKKSICSESSLRRYTKKCETYITGEIIDRAIASWILYILNSNLLQLGSNTIER